MEGPGSFHAFLILTVVSGVPLPPTDRHLPPDKEPHVEILTEKRARLRRELQQAYSAWMTTDECRTRLPTAGASADISGYSDAGRAKWLDYLAAKERMVLAYAEQPVTA